MKKCFSLDGMVSLWRLGVLGVVISLVSGCTSMLQPVTTTNSNLTQGNIEMNLRSGQTTKAEVLQAFGSPNVVTRDGKGNEVWTYQRAMQASQQDANSGFWTLFFVGKSRNQSVFETTSRMITLIIKFTNHDVVEDFNSRTSHF
jgi:outer membrane protein assembly factor BamE (lipoprotein component of BamABCDE complex)